MQLKVVTTLVKFTLCLMVFIGFGESVYADDFVADDEFIEGSSSQEYTLDTENEAGAGERIILRFGQTLDERLEWVIDDSRFEFSDSVRIEGNQATVGQTFVADNHDATDSDGIINLGKNGGVFESIVWDDSEDRFVFSDSIDLALGEFFNARFENLSADPACDVPSTGRVYFNTNLDEVRVCDGATFIALGGGGGDFSNGGEAGGADRTLGNTDNFDLSFITNNTNRLHIQNNGFVGIGTDVPDRPLTVQGVGGGTEWISFKDTGGTTQWHINYLTGLGFNFVESGVSDGRFYLEDGGNIGVNTFDPDSQFDIQNIGEVIEVGDGTAADSFINFDDGTDRNFGWDDSENSFSTYNQQLRFRTRQGANPPQACSAAVFGMQWMDTDTGILYICDTSNGRNKWLSVMEFHLSGGETGNCAAGAAPTSEACTQDIHNGVDANDLGYQIPRNATIVGGSFHSDQSCTNGLGVDLEVASGDNGGVAFTANVLTNCTDGNGCSNVGNDIDINQNTVIRARLDNNCVSGNVSDWSSILLLRWRHD